jgi:5-formyltetrahydrofolate cyclo-ligase
MTSHSRDRRLTVLLFDGAQWDAANHPADTPEIERDVTVRADATDKAAVRRRLLAARRAMTPEQLGSGRSHDHAWVAGTAGGGRSTCVAAYVDFGTEPATGPLLTTLADRGVGVLLPVLRADADLDWARFAGPASLVAEPAGSSLLAPAGARLGLDALAAADVVVVPRCP